MSQYHKLEVVGTRLYFLFGYEIVTLKEFIKDLKKGFAS